MKTSLSTGPPTGLQPLVARRRLTFCLAPTRPGAGSGACFWVSRVRPEDTGEAAAEEVLAVAWGHSLASFRRAGGWSRPGSRVGRWGLGWVEGGVLGRGRLERGRLGARP